MPFNPKIHHRRSIRIKEYDYSQAGLYFITICCRDRICRFGKIENGEMILNDLGKIVMQCWLDIPQHFPCAILHEYVIMPNHIHGIIELTVVGAQNLVPLQIPQMPLQIPQIPLQIPQIQIPQKNAFQKIIPRSIGSIIRGFKIGVTIETKKILPVYSDSVWQRNYYEQIIRDEQSHKNIVNYIINNPTNWKG